jgi:hypothetical protein
LIVSDARSASGSLALDVFYQPLLELVKSSKRLNGLSLPLVQMRSFAAKRALVDNGNSSPTETSVLISTQRLQRYTQGYIALRPLLQFAPTQWSGLFSGPHLDVSALQSFLQTPNLSALQDSRVRLQTLLTLIDSAIAQESIWAGEPVLDLLAAHVNELLDTQQPLTDNLTEDARKAAVQNPVLLQNLLVYLLQSQATNFDHAAYDKALQDGNVQELKVALGDSLGGLLGPYLQSAPPTSLQLLWMGKYLSPLPSRQEIESAQIHYRPNLFRLVSLHDRTVEAIVGMNLSGLSPDTQRKLMFIQFILPTITNTTINPNSTEASQ